jgi:hypothetical protein
MRERHVLAVSLLLLVTIFMSPSFAQGPANGGSAVAAVFQLPSQAVQQRLDALFYDWQTYQLDLAGIERAVRRSDRVQIDLGGRLFDLELQPNDVRASGYVEIYHTTRGPVLAKPSAVATFKGVVAGEPDSVVRLLVLPDLLQGYIKSGKDLVFIDPLLKYAKGPTASHIVVFDERDVRPEAAGLCGIGELHSLAAKLPTVDSSTKDGSIDVVTAAATYRRADLATEADYEYHSRYGANANSQIQGVINQVDGIYKLELSLTMRIVYQSVWTTSNDPYISSDPATLLYEFRDYWNAYRGDVGRDAAHLFTDRDMGNTYGVAWLGSVCKDPSNAYGVSRNHGLMAKVVAHEIGHNLAAFHDDEVSPPASTCNGYGMIMCSFSQPNGPNSFSQRSKNDISSHVAYYGSCLETISTPTICKATASCANAGGGSVSCQGSNSSCFARNNCYASCNGQQYYCPKPTGICPY